MNDEQHEYQDNPEDRSKPAKRISFDDFEIERSSGEQPSVRGGFLKNAVPRIRTLSGDLLGGSKKISSKLFKGNPEPETPQEEHQWDPPAQQHDPLAPPYFSDDEQTLIRVRKMPKAPKAEPVAFKQEDTVADPAPVQSPKHPVIIEPLLENAVIYEETEIDDVEIDDDDEEIIEDQSEETIDEQMMDVEDEDVHQVIEELGQTLSLSEASVPAHIPDYELPLDPAVKVYLDTLRRFDSHPRRSGESRDPRKDFVLLLSELLDLLRDHTVAQSALFFWVNHKKQQLVLECASVDDFAFHNLLSERRYEIGHDAVSKVAIRSEPQFIQSIPPQAEYDLIPYYKNQIGVRSFAAMPVLFSDSLVAVLAVDSLEDAQFSAETLRLLTEYSSLISGLVRSYIESYDLLTSARTLESARKLYMLTGADLSSRAPREAGRTGEYILRTLSEAAGELVEWEWFSTIAFDEAQRTWGIQHLQAKDSEGYVAPRTQIALAESIVGKSLQSGTSMRIDALNRQSVRFSLLEDHEQAVGHSFLVIPIRTSNKNYGALAIEHSEGGDTPMSISKRLNILHAVPPPHLRSSRFLRLSKTVRKQIFLPGCSINEVSNNGSAKSLHVPKNLTKRSRSYYSKSMILLNIKSNFRKKISIRLCSHLPKCFSISNNHTMHSHVSGSVPTPCSCHE